MSLNTAKTVSHAPAAPTAALSKNPAAALCAAFMQRGGDADAGVAAARSVDESVLHDPTARDLVMNELRDAFGFRTCQPDADGTGAWALDVRDVDILFHGWSARLDAVRLDVVDGGGTRERRVTLDPLPERCDKNRICSNGEDAIARVRIDAHADLIAEITLDTQSHECSDGVHGDSSHTTTVHFHVAARGNTVRWVPPPT